MKIRMAAKLVALGAMIVGVGHWLRGHDILTAVALLLPLLFVGGKVFFVLLSGRGGSPPSSGDSRPPIPPAPVKPAPRSPGAPPDVYCEHAA